MCLTGTRLGGSRRLGERQQARIRRRMLRASAFSHRWWSSQLPVLGFATQLVAFRRAHPVFRRDRFLAGAEASELQWFQPSGTPMTTTDWSNPDARSLAIFLDGVDDPDRAADGRPLIDDDFPLLAVLSWLSPD